VRVTDARAVLLYATNLPTKQRMPPYRRACEETTWEFLMAIGALDTARALFEDAVTTTPCPSVAG